MLTKLLFKYQNKTQIFIALIGACIGFIFILLSIHYVIRINEFEKTDKKPQTNKLIIQKKVSNFSSLNLTKPYFDDDEIKSLSTEKSILSVEPVINNNFEVSLATDGELIPYLRSDIFIQGIQAHYIEIDENDWTWEKGDDFLPIVIPRDFLIMINTFASAKGIPQISDDLAKSLTFKLSIFNGNRKEEYNAQIIGFTNEISSILVPIDFINYGNHQFTNSGTNKITQLFVTIKDGQFGVFEKVLKKRGLETKESVLMINKAKSIANSFFFIINIISFTTILLSFLIFQQYAQLLIFRNQYEIKTLLRIGYFPKQIEDTILRYFISLAVVIIFISAIIFILIKWITDSFLIKNGINIETHFMALNFLIILLILALFLMLLKWNVKKNIKNI